jgi:RNA polymerase sigma factor (TIGR02999 family)
MSDSAGVSKAGASPGEITALLKRWRVGEAGALEALAPLVYDELRRLARSALRGSGGQQTLQPTALVNELFLRLLGRPAALLEDRRHFFALSARILRQVLVDHARAEGARKRGGDMVTVDLSQVDPAGAALPAVDLLDLDRALARLRDRDPEIERLVELRYFGGLTIDESAAALDRSPASIGRDWAVARAFLFRELSPKPGTAIPS